MSTCLSAALSIGIGFYPVFADGWVKALNA